MITAGDFRKGVTFEMEGNVYVVVDFLHVKPGKGSPFVRTKLKNVETGQVVEKTFRAGEKVAKAMLDRREMQFLYKEGADLVMMDLESYEQLPVPVAQVGDGVKYLKENMNVQILLHDSKIIGIDLPNFVELEVIDTPPAEKGNTAQGGTKPATLEGGAVVNVPFHIQNGDLLKIDTRTNEYLGKA